MDTGVLDLTGRVAVVTGAGECWPPLSVQVPAELHDSGVRVFAFGPWGRTAMTEGLATSPAFTAQQREMFAPPEDAVAARRLAGSILMLQQMIIGDLGQHVGGFLDSEAPPG